MARVPVAEAAPDHVGRIADDPRAVPRADLAQVVARAREGRR
ncbi:hypothetical protein ACQ4WX_17110 [Streptomyces lasalocidi]